MSELLFKEECYAIIGACFEVYNEMGNGFVEPVYQECLELELSKRQLPFNIKTELKLHYKDQLLKQTYRPDFILYDQIILEIKAVSHLIDEHRAQVHNYLKATRFRLGLLVNFGQASKLDWERIVR